VANPVSTQFRREASIVYYEHACLRVKISNETHQDMVQVNRYRHHNIGVSYAPSYNRGAELAAVRTFVAHLGPRTDVESIRVKSPFSDRLIARRWTHVSVLMRPIAFMMEVVRIFSEGGVRARHVQIDLGRLRQFPVAGMTHVTYDMGAIVGLVQSCERATLAIQSGPSRGVFV